MRAVEQRNSNQDGDLPVFARILVAQAQVEEITLLTTDAGVTHYPGPIVRV